MWKKSRSVSTFRFLCSSVFWWLCGIGLKTWMLFLCSSIHWFHPWGLWGEKIWDLPALRRKPLRPKLLLQHLLRGSSQVPGPGLQQCRGGAHLDPGAQVPDGRDQRWRQSGPQTAHPRSISFIHSFMLSD